MDTEELSKTEVHFKGEKLAAGILVNNTDDYEFFKSYYESNWAHIQTCFHYEVNSKAKRFHHDNWRPLENLFLPFLEGSLIVLAVIIVVGAIYEFKRRRMVE